MLRRFMLQQPIARATDQEQSEKHPDPGAKVGEADVGGAEIVVLHEDKGEGCVEEIKDPVDESRVDGHEEDDGGAEEHFDRTDQGATDAGFVGEAGVLSGAEFGVTSFFLEFGGFAGEEDGGVGLAAEEEVRDGADPIGDGEDPEGPAPAFGGAEVGAGDGADDGACGRKSVWKLNAQS